MADTVRDRTTLVGLLADNSTQNITEQVDRDVLVSIMGVYAQLYLSAGATAQSVDTSWATLDWSAGANGLEDAADADYTADRISIGSGAGGVWEFHFQNTFTGTASTEFAYKLAVNGTRQDRASCKVALDASGNAASCSFSALVQVAAGDLVTVQVSANGASKSITPREMQLVAKRVA